jgi:hypothetical protein
MFLMKESNYGDMGYPDVDDEPEGIFNVYSGWRGMLST